MKKNLLIKTLAVGIIFLFIGVAVAPSTAVETTEKVDASLVNDTSEEDCDCKSANYTKSTGEYPYPILCELLHLRLMSLGILMWIPTFLAQFFRQGSTIGDLLVKLGNIYLMRGVLIFFIGAGLGCWEYDPPPPT